MNNQTTTGRATTTSRRALNAAEAATLRGAEAFRRRGHLRPIAVAFEKLAKPRKMRQEKRVRPTTGRFLPAR